MADGRVQPRRVPPVNPGQGGQLDVLDGSPRTTVEDELRLVQPDDRLGQSVVVGIAPRADGGEAALGGQALGVDDGEVLTAPVAVVDQAVEALLRDQMAISKASRARLVARVVATRQPTMRRENTSMTKAV